MVQSIFFLPPYQLTFFLVFDQATDQKGFFSSCSHILMNILSMNYYNYVTKRSLNNFHTESFHKTANKTRKEQVFQNVFLTKLCNIFILQGYGRTFYIKGTQKHLFADVLRNRCS